jgi:hypothetical protein
VGRQRNRPAAGRRHRGAFATSTAFFFSAALAWIAAVWIFMGSTQRIRDEVPEESRVAV